jgi:hypothetical protein
MVSSLECNLDKKLPKELKEIGDKHMPLAYMMRQNPPEEIEFNMTGFQPEIIKENHVFNSTVLELVKMLTQQPYRNLEMITSAVACNKSWI